MDYKLHKNKGLWHVNFYVADAKGKNRRKQLSTGVRALDNMIRETNDYRDFLCVNPVGALITPDSITHQFTKLLDENNLPHIRFHELRHSCISLLANNNAFSMKQIQDYAGHSDFLTTFNVYSHTDDSDKKTEMDYISSCFTDLFDTDKEE